MRAIRLTALLAALLVAAPAYAAVDINTAPAADLATLDGVTEELSNNIVREREENGPFTSVEDLTRVPGMTPEIIATLKARAVATPSTAAPKTPKPGGQDAEVRKVLKKFEKEPTVQQVQEAALDYARSDPSLIDSWRIRSRLRGIAPEFRVRTLYDVDRDYLWNQATVPPAGQTPFIPPQPSPTTPRRDVWNNNVNVYAQGTWNLDRLIFDPEETRVNREAVRLAKQMDQVLDDVTRRYFERRRLQVEMELNPPTDVGDRLRKEIRLQELTADLDGMTGGYFSSRLKAQGK